MSKLYVWSSFAQCGCGGGRLYIAAMSWASSGPGSNPKANMPAANCWTNHNEAEAFLSPAVTLPHDHGASVHSLLWSNGQKAHIAISFFFFHTGMCVTTVMYCIPRMVLEGVRESTWRIQVVEEGLNLLQSTSLANTDLLKKQVAKGKINMCMAPECNRA